MFKASRRNDPGGRSVSPHFRPAEAVITGGPPGQSARQDGWQCCRGRDAPRAIKPRDCSAAFVVDCQRLGSLANASHSQAVITHESFPFVPDVSGTLALDVANFQQSSLPPSSSLPPLGAGSGDVSVIYCRYSSELQRTDSIKDRERRCRDGLERKNIPHGNFVVIADEAISGTQQSRPGLSRIRELMRDKRLRMLVVTELSRLTRGDNAKAFIKNIIYQGGRFISITENIDTNHKGWQLPVGFSELHHSRSNDDTAERVRGAQEGRVRDGNGSAGDFPYGYASEFDDPVAAANYRGRGPKPHKHVVIHEPAAKVVRMVFEMFASGESITAIVAWWEQHKAEYPPITKTTLHHQHVRRILANPKYIGVWKFGETTTVRDDAGNKKQIKAFVHQQVTSVSRPDLRIISQGIWDKVQLQLAKLKEVYGKKAEGKKRGPAEYYKLLYAKTLLNGLVHCSICKSRLVVMCSSTAKKAELGGKRQVVKRLGCPKHKVGKCPMAARVPYDLAERKLLEILQQILTSYPEWISRAAEAAREHAADMARNVPTDSDRVAGELSELEQEIGNLLDALAKGIKSTSIVERLTKLETQKHRLTEQLEDLKRIECVHVSMPDDTWIDEQLREVGRLLTTDMPTVAQTLRSMIGRINAEEVRPAGKKRGYIRLRFRLDGWAALKPLLEPSLSADALERLSVLCDGAEAGEEFTVELGAPSRMDSLVPQIGALRDAGVKWKDILRRFSAYKLTLGNAWTAYQRWKESDV